MFPHHKAGFVDDGCVPGWWMWQGLLLCACRGVEFILRSGSLSPVMVPAKVPSFSSRSAGCVGSHADVPFSWLAVCYCLLPFYTVSEPPKSTLPCSPADHWEAIQQKCRLDSQDSSYTHWYQKRKRQLRTWDAKFYSDLGPKKSEHFQVICWVGQQVHLDFSEKLR